MVVMPPKRADGSKGRKPRKMPPKDTEEYLHRRERNNVAVQKSRDKSRQKAKETMERVERLKSENEDLEQQVKILAKELSVLKDLFKMVHPLNGGQCSATEAGIQTETVAVKKESKAPVKEDAILPDEADVIISIEPVNEETVVTLTDDEQVTETVGVNLVAMSKDHEYIASPKFEL